MVPHNVRAEIAGMTPDEKVDHLLAYMDMLIPQYEPQAMLLDYVREITPGKTFYLTKADARFLYALTTPMGRIAAYERLVYLALEEDGGDTVTARNNLASQVKRLRLRIAPVGWDIQNVYGVGYRLVDKDPSKTKPQLPWLANGAIDPRIIRLAFDISSYKRVDV